MKQTICSKKDRPLLTYAISKLNPEVFAHPVWIHFSHKNRLFALDTVQDLIAEAKQLQRDNPGDACQVLLACAVYQNYANQRDHALRTTQQALALAERNSLTREIIWATWGACALCFQQGNYEQAARYLEYLQAGLSAQNEWILADFIEMVKQSLPHRESVSTNRSSGTFYDRSSDDLLSITFDWLRQWGASPQASRLDFETDPHQSITNARAQERPAQLSFSLGHRRGGLNTFLRAIKDALRLQWVETNQQPTGQRLSIASSVPEEPVTNTLSHESRQTFTANEVSGHATNVTAVVQMLGSFSMTIQDVPVKLPASRGLSLLKYLLLHHKQDIPREVLMDIFWPDADPEASRNNLNVAMHSLRQALRSSIDVVLICFEDGAYGFAPNVDIWLDVEEFEQCIKEGQRLEIRNQTAAAVTNYEIAVNLYQGDFLADNPYEGWAVSNRERLRVAYLETLDRLSQIYFSQERYAACITLCQLILTQDLCREDAHCRLMQCYCRLGQGPLALRQYQICAEALRGELEVNPARETTELYDRIRRRERV